MGSMVEINDTLQLTREQGFPEELSLEMHLKTPIELENVANTIFNFRDKPTIRNFQQAPVRVFLVENIGGKWVYWGHVHVLEVTHDYVAQITTGKYKIVYLNTPDEMKLAHHLIDGRPEMDYFSAR